MSMGKVALDGSAEIPQILHALDQGTVMIRFFRRRGTRPEKRIFCLKTDTFEILQYPLHRGRLTLSEETSTSGGGSIQSSDYNQPHSPVVSLLH